MSAGEPDSELSDGLIRQPRADATVLRMLLGSQLRRLREAAGVTPEDAGYEIRGSRSKISRMENGRVSFKDRDIADYAYHRGALALLDFLDAERSYRAEELGYRQTLASYLLALEQLREAVGVRTLP